MLVRRAHIENTGDSTWLCRAAPVGGFVTVGCKLLEEAGRLVDDTLGRTCLPRDLAPGEGATVQIAFTLPDTIGPGTYIMRVDVVNELVAWFGDYPGNAPVEFAVRIT